MSKFFLGIFCFLVSFYFCFAMENSASSSSISTSCGSCASFENLPGRPLVEGTSISLEPLPFRQLTIGGDGDSIRISANRNSIISGEQEESFFLEHTKAPDKGTVSPDKSYFACYGHSNEGSWIDIFDYKTKQKIYNYPMSLGQFVDMRWKDSQLVIATIKDIHILTLQNSQELKPVINEKTGLISKTGKEIKSFALINNAPFLLLKKGSKAAYIYEFDISHMKRKHKYILHKGEGEKNFFLNSPKEKINSYLVASSHFLWQLSTQDSKKRVIPIIEFPSAICAFMVVSSKPHEVIFCAQENKKFSLWDVTEKLQIKNVPEFDIKDLGRVIKISMYNQELYVSDDKSTIKYPITQLLRAAYPHMSFA